MTSAGSQFLLLLWKNFKLQSRKKCVTVFEFIVPIFFALLLFGIRAISKSEYISQISTWPSFDPSTTDRVISSRDQLFFTPNDTNTRDIMATVATETSTIAVGYNSEGDLINAYNANNNTMWAGVVFNTDISGGLPADISYTLRVSLLKSDEDRWRTDRVFQFFQTFGPRNNETTNGEPSYAETGFLRLQYEINKALINKITTNSFTNLDVALKKMPYPDYLSDVLTTVLQTNLPLFLVLSFILNALQMAKNIAYEKEKKLKESMKMMGLSTSIYWLSWFIKNLLYLMIVIFIYTVIFYIPIGDKGRVINYTNPVLFFFFLLCYIIATIAFCFMISTFFQKANSAAFACGIIFFLSYFPYFFLTDRYETMTQSEKMASCLLHNVGMAMGCKVMLIYEGTGDGAQWNNFYQPPIVDDNFSLLDAIIMLLVDAIIYMLIAWYVDNINPGDAGVAQPPWFPFMPSFWMSRKVGDSVMDLNGDDHGRNEAYFERDPPDAKVGINIRHLRKAFGSKVAVRDTSIKMFEGQITALLGHNGAGKTTTISMLTGFLEASSGTATINGYDIRTDITSVRKTLGLCPQHNILFDLLTVKEHLEFFAKLKGCPSKDVKGQVEEMLKVLGMEGKQHTQSQFLSGGQKRKLSVGIALIADSKTVILDEPTSGMDPAARRQTWEILQKCRKNRTIILTTHFMDEADVLGDRIAIMADGVVKCCGTSMFLKKLYGAGYHLVMVKDSSCNVANLTKVIQSHVPSAAKDSEISAEISYLLPFNESAKFEQLFADIEGRKKELGIKSFGTSATTMEEVFLKVGEGAADEENDVDDVETGMENPAFSVAPLPNKAFEPKADFEGGRMSAPGELAPIRGSPEYMMNKNGALNLGYNTNGSSNNFYQNLPVNSLSFNKDIDKNTGFKYTMQQFYGMFVKKFIHARRNKAVLAAQLILPVVFGILALLVESTVPSVGDEPNYTLDLSHFNEPFTPYSDGNSPTADTTSYANAYIFGISSNEKVTRGASDTMDAYFSSKEKELGIGTFNRKVIIAGDFQDGTSITATGHFNGQPYHGIATSLQYVMNGILRKLKNDNNYKITANNHPLPKKVSDNVRRLFFATNGTGFVIAIAILFGMAFMATSFIIFLIKERSVGAKHLQVVSGVGPLAFWTSTFLWDFINYLVPTLLLLIVFAAFQTSAYVDNGRLGIVFLIFLLYGWSVLPFAYLLHYLFKVPATGMVVVSMINLCSGLVFLLATYTLSIPQLGTEDIGKALEWVFLVLFPNYNLGLAMMDMYTNSGYQDTCDVPEVQQVCRAGVPNPCCFPDNCGNVCFTYYSNFLKWEKPGIGREVLFMLIQGVVYFVLVLMAEAGLFSKLRSMVARSSMMAAVGTSNSNLQEDADVAEERKRIEETPMQELIRSDSLLLKNVSKVYDNGFRAVKGLSVGVPSKECFGLLGQNGAGKTSTFKMMTGDEIMTSGSAFLNGKSVTDDIKQVQQMLGYCPQFDSLIDQMTGRETLYMYARLRGVKEHQIEGVVNKLIDILMLKKHADKQTGFYSGGNKRKLSTAIALIGDPPFIFLDEPTTGMDPGARRKLWNVLSMVREEGKTLILTSHSMEECDVLCTRLVIMVNGRFVCYGSPNHLKNTFGHGYTLFCRMGINSNGFVESSSEVEKFVKDNFPNAEVFDNNQGYVHFRIPDDNANLAKIFGRMELAKQQFNVEDYSVHETTLEQVFLTFTQHQVPPAEEKKKTCAGCRAFCC